MLTEFLLSEAGCPPSKAYSSPFAAPSSGLFFENRTSRKRTLPSFEFLITRGQAT